MKYNPRIHYSYRDELYHSRPKGSRNGFSTIPGYIPRGKKAVGIKQPDGSYLYLESGAHPELARGAVAAGQIRQQQFQNSTVGKNLPSVTDLQRQHGQSYVNAREQQQRQGSAINAKAGRLAGKTFQQHPAVTKPSQNNSKGYTDTATSNLDPQKRNPQSYLMSAGAKVKGAANNVGNWLNNSRKNVTNWFNQAGDNVRGAAGNLRNRIEEAWDGSAGAGSAKDKANAAQVRADRYTQYMRNGDRSSDYSKQMKGAAINQRRIAREETDKYNKSIKGRAENFAKSVTGAGRNVGNWLNTARTNVGKAAGNARDWVNQAGDNVRNGTVQRAITDTAKNVRNRIGEAWDGSAGAGSAKDKANAAKSRASSAIETARHIPNNSKGRAMGNKLKQQAADALREASAETTKYNNSIKGRIENTFNRAGKNVKGAANNVGNWLNEARTNVGKAVSGAGSRASEFISNLTGNNRSTTGGQKTINIDTNAMKAEAKSKSAEQNKKYAEHAKVVEKNYKNAQKDLNDLILEASKEFNPEKRSSLLEKIDEAQDQVYSLQQEYTRYSKYLDTNTNSGGGSQRSRRRTQ